MPDKIVPKQSTSRGILFDSCPEHKLEGGQYPRSSTNNQPSGQQLIPTYYLDLMPSTVSTSRNFCQRLMSRENLYAVLIFNKSSGPTSRSFNIGQSFSGVHHNNNTEIL